MPEQIVTDEILGTLEWNPELDWWEGETDIEPGHRIRFSLASDEADGGSVEKPTEEIAKARAVLLFLCEHEPEARLVAADELLDIYNAEWNTGAPLNEDEFMARLTLDDVSIAGDGSAELFYADEGLFAGHAVIVTIDANGNFADADIAG